MISSLPPNTEARRRPSGALALILGELSQQLDERLDDPSAVLETLVTLAAKGENVAEVWSKLHASTERFSKTADLALGYERLTRDKRIKLLAQEQQAFIYLRAAQFFGNVLGDLEGAAAYAELALAQVPGPPEAFELLESLLTRAGRSDRLAELLSASSALEGDPQARLGLLHRAFTTASEGQLSSEIVIDLGNRVLSLNPGDGRVRDEVMRRLLVLGRHNDVVELLERALRSQPPPAPEEASLHREQLVDLCYTVLKDPERALAHVEETLSGEPGHAMARKAAEDLLGNPELRLRAAAALSDAFDKTGDHPRAIQMLELELEQVRGPRRVEVQRRLAIHRQDSLGDREGALELLGPVVAGDPGDDRLRQRFVALSLALNQAEQAARLLTRALGTHKDPSLRARVGLDVARIYLASGDAKRAQSIFEKVLEGNADENATLSAANELSELYPDGGDEKQLARALEAQVRLEPEREARQVAARRLMQLSDVGGSVPDPRRALLALRALVGSPWSEEAISRLEALYSAAGDDLGLSDVLAFRAERCPNADEARELRERALELRTRGLPDSQAAIEAYLTFSKTFGHSRELHARLAPLLEQAGRFQELVEVLLGEIDLAPTEEQVGIWFRVAELRRSQLSDPDGALEALTWAVALDPEDLRSRSSLEELLHTPQTRLHAAAILEPLYRRQKVRSGLFRVFEVRAEAEPEAARRLDAADEALRVAEENPEEGLERRLDLAGRALLDAVGSAPERVPEWLLRVESLAIAASKLTEFAELLSFALLDRAVDSAHLFELARTLGKALVATGDVPGALLAYRRALAFAPTSRELVQAIDTLLVEQGSPQERLALYQTALEYEQDPLRSCELLYSMGRLLRFELGDLPGAIATFERLIAANPSHSMAHEALLEALDESGDYAAVARELARLLPEQGGEQYGVTLTRLAQSLERAGDIRAALSTYRRLLETTEPSREVLEKIERLAFEQSDGPTLVLALDRHLKIATDPLERAELFERLGDAHARHLGDVSSATRHWLEGARIASEAADGQRARRLYQRVLEIDPKCTEAAARLIELAAQAGDFASVRSAFEVFLGSADDDAAESVLLALEHPAVACRAVQDLVQLTERLLERVTDPSRARRLKLLKARCLGTDPEFSAPARAMLRELLESAQGDAPEECEAFASLIARLKPSSERASDLRVLYKFKLARAADPAGLLLSWARAEERELQEPRAAVRLYRRAIEQDPERIQAYLELARLEADSGKESAALATLEELGKRAKPEEERAVRLATAELYIERLGRADQALSSIESILAANPSDRDALRLAHGVLAIPKLRPRVLQILEQAAHAFNEPAQRAEVIEALLAVCAGSPDLAEARNRWVRQLLESSAEDLEATLGFALRGAEAAPSELELWRFAERTAGNLAKPEPVADSYARVFERGVAPELADKLGRMMVDFHEEWFDDPERIVRLLERVLSLCPNAGWAFDRLKLAFNGSGRWPELFALYDLRLSNLERDLRVELLREAAMAARDFASDPERAVGYLEALNQASPGDGRVEASLERLYERLERKRPLIALLSARLSTLARPEQGGLKGRIAALWLDLQEPEPAFLLARELFVEKSRADEAVRLLERLLTLPLDPNAVTGSDGSPFLRATAVLKAHYAASGQVSDVVRMLEIEVRAASSDSERRALLEQIVHLRLEDLKDVAGAFETTSELVLLDPESSAYRKQLADLGKHVGEEHRRVEVLVSAAAQARVSVRAGLLSEAASVCRHALGDEPRAVALYREVVRENGVPTPIELGAVRELSLLLRGNGAPLERVSLLERLADLEKEPELRRSALGEAAELAFEKLSDPLRAIACYDKCVADDPNDLQAMNGLCRALESVSDWDRLIAALQSRAAIQPESAARADRVRIAEIHETMRGDRDTAIQAWRGVVSRHGGDQQSFEALLSLLTGESRWSDLGQLLTTEIQTARDDARRRQLLLELGTLHENNTHDWQAALDAFVAADDWSSAVRVVSSAGADRAASRRVSASLLEQAVSAWQAVGTGAESPPALAADWALGDLCDKLLTEELYEEVVERLLAGSELALPVAKRRELVREAACLSADRLGDPERAIALFQRLLEEDGADEIASSSVTRLALLLEEKGRFDSIAMLWERQAAVRALVGDQTAAQMLWARAGEIAEERLADPERALHAYERGAELGGEVCLEALARVFGARGNIDQVALALERLCTVSSPELLAHRALRLADAYWQIGQRARAREALEQAVPRVSDAQGLRARLAELYREAEDFTALARLFEENADRAQNPAQALALLKDAAELHLERRQQPAPAVPVLERAIALDPTDPALRLRLAQALYAAERLEDAANVLRDQLGRYGTRRPKDRALVHYELARVLLAESDRAGALAELDAAARIDPAHPKILQMLARTALGQGEPERAERMFRALLLMAPKEGDLDAPSKSEALVALGAIARDRGDSLRFDEFISSAFDAAEESPREMRTLEQALRGLGRPDLVARALEARLKQRLPVKETALCLAALCELHAGELGDLPSVRNGLLTYAGSLEEELLRRESVDDEAWEALGRAYFTLEERAAEARILERRVEASARSSRPPPSPDLYYRLAAVRLEGSVEIEQGLDLLERAIDLGFEVTRAEALLRKNFAEGSEPPRVLDLLERSARAQSNRSGLLQVLVRRVGLGDADLALVREGVALSEELDQPELGDRLLGAAILAGTADSVPADAAWLRLELARRSRSAGDLPKALLLEEQAAGYLAAPAARTLLLSVARDAVALGDVERAARLLEHLLHDDPEDRDVFEPLLDLYRQTDQTGKLVRLLEDTAPLVKNSEERSLLRLEQAELLLDKLDHKHEAMVLLREIVRADPRQRRAHARLFELLDAEGREDELIELFDLEIDAQREQGDVEAASALALRLIAWLERHGRSAEALLACRSALKHDPGRRELLEVLLRLADASADPALAGDALESLLQGDCGSATPPLCRRLLNIRESCGDAEGLERALELGFAASPDDLELCDRLADRISRRGNLARLADLFEHASRARPGDRSLVERLTETYRGLGRHDQALAALETLQSLAPEDVFVHRTRGAILADLGRLPEAIGELELAATQDPGLLGELAQALERALELARPEERGALGAQLVHVLERAGDLPSARSRLLALVDANPNSSELLRRLADLEARSGDEASAIEGYARLIDLLHGPEVVPVALVFGELAQRAGQASRARTALERALAADPDNPAVLARLVEVLESDGAYRALADLLRAEAERETRRDERAKKLLRVAELLLLPDGDLEQARELLEFLRVEIKDSLEVVALLGRAYTESGRLDDALALLDGCLEAHRGKRLRALAPVYEQKADVHLEEGILTDGVAALAKAFEMDPKNARIGMRLARLAIESDEGEVAQRALRAVAIMKTAAVDGSEGARAETKADANFFLAELAQRAGDPRKARVLAAKALSENPDHEQARVLLKTLDKR